MNIIRITTRRDEAPRGEQADRFDARLEALSRATRRPIARRQRESLFEWLRSQATRQEDAVRG